jgi:mannose-6-phosphate isomerase
MIAERLVDWMRKDALPFWLANGFDAESGLPFERLHLDGTPDRATPVRLRTAFRQIYVASHAVTLGLASPEAALPLAVRAAERLRACGWNHAGAPGWVHSVALDGTILDAHRDLYDHACALLALAHLHHATGDARYASWIDETLAAVDDVLAAPYGGWAESERGEVPRRQNPHMHLFEASLALYETTGEARHLARAGELFSLFRTRFFDDDLGTLREFFGPAWERTAAYNSGRLDPGHMMEWVWLVRRYGRAAGRDVDDLARRLFEAGQRLGLDEASGFLVDEVDADGTPIGAGRRLWPQTEFLKALTVQWDRTGDTAFSTEADRLAGALFDDYLPKAKPGRWQDHFALDGSAIASHIPASSLYHLLAAVAELIQIEHTRR